LNVTDTPATKADIEQLSKQIAAMREFISAKLDALDDVVLQNQQHHKEAQEWRQKQWRRWPRAPKYDEPLCTDPRWG
jgi:hypothetical protein